MIFRRNTILMIATAMIVAKLVILVFSSTLIIPPTDPLEPVTVYVLDYGFHSRLVLPDRAPRFVQYAYGDWEHFAQQHHDPITTLKALFIPTQGTLAREEFTNFSKIKEIVEPRSRITLLEVEVAREKMVKLRAKLQYRLHRNLDSKVEYNGGRLQFVKDDQDYSLFYNSNHQVAEWLQELECEVKGIILLPNFEVKSHH